MATEVQEIREAADYLESITLPKSAGWLRAYAATLEAKPERATQAQVTRYDLRPHEYHKTGHLIFSMEPRKDGAYVLWHEVAPLLAPRDKP
jgi:hypothetical protein